ncbi:hypothetical protein TTHERM_000414249 (macronuclear) [Tetrahymena thermophila SB210]|uniref:Kinase domain protein n=1 Tax=Tetrahymena thermophila (strain SB210) TaxID=312017 RepID=W7XKJ9_TETTS|nr:hypothetical protein TTHERM_000414249 [Tetrahymena thermophila SB210]EWS76596.1 hypothetical protein TTHERM_000414249 [Tetrahymena thermophila SB210]|eukprot:XP_012650882.1 hypothetical protein TTHERM_000414249 [Tetrahymena thermophila SB210]
MGISCSKEKQNSKIIQSLYSKIYKKQDKTDLILYLKAFINDEQSNAFKTQIKNFQNTEFLDLGVETRHISFKSLQVIAESFLHLQFLRIVKLHVLLEQFTSTESVHVASILENTNLKKIVITTQGNVDNENNQIKKFFGNISGFQCLFARIQCDSFDNYSIELLFDPFIKLTEQQLHLQVFHLNFISNQISDGGAIQISKALKIQQFLQDITVDLSKNQIDTLGAISLISCVKELKFLKLYGLGLEKNKLKSLIELNEDDENDKIPTQLNKLEVFSLNLRFNYMNDNILVLLVKYLNIYAFTQEIQLDLSYNQIDFKGVNALSQSFQQFKNLKCAKLLLGQNQIQQTGANTLYTTLLNNSFLKQIVLNLKRNQVVDYLQVQNEPQLNNLQILDINISENTLESGAVNFFESISQFKNLKTLKLRLEHITQIIPLDNLKSTITSLKLLEAFTFSHTDLNQNDVLKIIQICKGITNLSTLSLAFKASLNFELQPIASELKKLDRVKSLKFQLRAKQQWRQDQIQNVYKVTKKLKRLVLKNINIE